MAVDLPCVVWVDISGGSRHGPSPWLGLLVEWRQVRDRKGNKSWEGMVAIARAGGWYVRPSVTVEWVPAAYLMFVDLSHWTGWGACE